MSVWPCLVRDPTGMLRVAGLLLGLAAGLTSYGCGPSDPARPTPTEGATAQATPGNGAADLASVSPFAQHLVVAFAADDTQALREAIRTQRLPCSDANPIEGPPCR
jgi:hypothetical protein